MSQLKEEADKKPMSKYGVICFDEVKIKEGVVYNPHTAELIGLNVVCMNGMRRPL